MILSVYLSSYNGSFTQSSSALQSCLFFQLASFWHSITEGLSDARCTLSLSMFCNIGARVLMILLVLLVLSGKIHACNSVSLKTWWFLDQVHLNLYLFQTLPISISTALVLLDRPTCVYSGGAWAELVRSCWIESLKGVKKKTSNSLVQ